MKRIKWCVEFSKKGFYLKNGCHHIAINEYDIGCLDLAWKTKYFFFLVLPFGISPALNVFTKRSTDQEREGKGQSDALFTQMEGIN